MKKEEFLNQYKTKEWYETSKRIKARDHNTCQMCGRNDRPLSVHHRYYGKNGSLKVPDDALITLCDSCHEQETYDKGGLYEHVKRLIDFCNENKLSMCFADSLLSWVFHILELTRDNLLDDDNQFGKRLLEEALFYSNTFSDFVEMKRLGIEMRECVERNYPEMIDLYDMVEVRK